MELLTIQKLYLFVHYCGIVSETCIVLECKRKLKLAMNQILDESSTAINHGVHQEREKKLSFLQTLSPSTRLDEHSSN